MSVGAPGKSFWVSKGLFWYLWDYFECMIWCLGPTWGSPGCLVGPSRWLRGFSYCSLEWGQSDEKLTCKNFFTFQVSCNISALHWPILFKFWWNDNYVKFAKQWWKPHLSISNRLGMGEKNKLLLKILLKTRGTFNFLKKSSKPQWSRHPPCMYHVSSIMTTDHRTGVSNIPRHTL